MKTYSRIFKIYIRNNIVLQSIHLRQLFAVGNIHVGNLYVLQVLVNYGGAKKKVWLTTLDIQELWLDWFGLDKQRIKKPF